MIDTAVGPANVLHRLALGVECRDALVDRLVLTSVRVGRKPTARERRRLSDLTWPCVNLEQSGPARFKLRQQIDARVNIELRVDDPTRRYVPRRFAVHPWPEARLDEASAQPWVPSRSRLLRTWMSPGSAYPYPRGATLVRGRVVRNSQPARWARLTATGPTNALAGRAQADDRGEFVLVITDPGQNPVERTVAIDIVVHAVRNPPSVDPFDRCADLVVEDIPRSSVPPTALDLDNPALRGSALPVGYAANLRNPTHCTVSIGAALNLTEDIVFDPQP